MGIRGNTSAMDTVQSASAQVPEATRTLRTFLEPMSPESFVRDHWLMRPALLRGSSGRFEPLFSSRDVDAALQRSHTRAHVALELGPGVSRKLRISPQSAAEFATARATVCIDAIHEQVPALESFLASLKAELGVTGKCLANVYASGDGHGFPLHFDHQEVFVVQIEGTKRWAYGPEPAMAHPPRGLVASDLPDFLGEHPWAELDVPREAELLEDELTPGDILYLPAGTWHRGRANGHSLALSITIAPWSFQDLLTRVVNDRMNKLEAWRRPVPGAESSLAGTDAMASFRAFVAARLDELRRELDPDRTSCFIAPWIRAMGQLPRGQGVVANTELSPDDLVRSTCLGPLRVFPEGDEIHLLHLDRKLVVPAPALDLIRAASNRASFVVRDALAWPETEGWELDEVVRLVEGLLRLGVLTLETRP